MATPQVVLFAETIAGMKKALKRRAYDSDSDSEIEAYSNRGQKLKKRARFARRGQLVPTNGPASYGEAVDYAGVRRPLIYRNPPMIDDDGYEVDSEDDEERVEEATATALELNPYANIRLEQILAPLTTSTDLPIHPTISKPFLSETLTELATQSSSLMRKENQALSNVRHLFTSLCGDAPWVPCETMVGENDIELFRDDHVAKHLLSLSKASTDASAAVPPAVNGNIGDESNQSSETAKAGASATDTAQEPSGNTDIAMADAEEPDAKGQTESTDNPAPSDETQDPTSVAKDEQLDAEKESGKLDGAQEQRGTAKTVDGQDTGKQNDLVQANDTQKEADKNIDQAASIPSERLEQAFIHPMFLVPAKAKIDRDVGLPENEAEDIRRLLALYVQKQEEVCRGTTRLHQGLLRAERLRRDVLHWSKAEAHSGQNRDMSDGEDWYDKEEWGLSEDLKKGHDEEEEEAITTAKTRRARR